jgi:hypothetical protein
MDKKQHRPIPRDEIEILFRFFTFHQVRFSAHIFTIPLADSIPSSRRQNSMIFVSAIL